MYLCKFGQNPSTGSKDIASERSYTDADADVDADGIGTKNNMSPTFGWGDITNQHEQLTVQNQQQKKIKMSWLKHFSVEETGLICCESFFSARILRNKTIRT